METSVHNCTISFAIIMVPVSIPLKTIVLVCLFSEVLLSFRGLQNNKQTKNPEMIQEYIFFEIASLDNHTTGKKPLFRTFTLCDGFYIHHRRWLF